MSGYLVHPTAILHPSAEIGAESEVNAFSVLGPGASIGRGVVVGRYCEIRSGCVIGNNVRFGSDCLLAEGTVIGDDCYISGRFTTCDKPDIDDPSLKVPAKLGRGVRVGVSVVVMPGVTIGDGATIGACSQVRRDVPAGETWYGNPARNLGTDGRWVWHDRTNASTSSGFDCGDVSVEKLRDGPE